MKSRLIKKEKNERYVKVCPKCGSMDGDFTSVIKFIGDTIPICKNCGNRGIFPEVKVSEVNKLRKLIRNKKSK